MAKWLGIELKARDFFTSEQALGKLTLLQAVRLGFFSVILFITILFQVRQPDFIGYTIIFPVYAMLTAAYFLNSFYTYFLKSFEGRLFAVTAALFVIDTVFITGLVYYTDFNQSIFLFMYLINIILCGLVFQRYGALTLALITSFCFSFLVVVGPQIQGPTLYFTVGLNNIAFLAVAYLSGYLSEQLNFMGSEIKARDQDIQALQNLNKMIVDNIATGLMTITTEGRILHSNPAARAILSRDDHGLTVGLSEIFPEVLHRIKSINFNSGAPLGRFEIFYVAPRGDRLLLGCSVSPLRETDGVLQGYILIFQDLTEIKRLERAVQRQEKLAAVGKLAAGIAHEIRNPLASISGSLQMLKASPRAPDEERLMAIALKEIDRLNGLITDFLDFVRPDSIIEKVVDLEALLKEVLDMARVNTRLRQDVLQETQFLTRRKIIGNPDKLKQVFLNLVINAYQAMEKSPHPKLTVSARFEKGIVKVSFRDSGTGMSDAIVKRLFEPFFTTKSSGTGLGLATTHKILEGHEAKIFVESNEGKGTEFLIEFTKLAPVEEVVNTEKASQVKRSHG